MVPELLVLALDFFRSPLRYRQLTEPRHPLPKAFDTLLPELAAAIAPQNMGTTARRLRRPPAEIEQAALFFIRQVLFVPGADHYRVLGLSQEAPESTVRQHYQLLIRLFHPDRSAGEHELDATYTVRLNDAYSTLRDPEARQDYDAQLASLGRSADALPEALAFKPSDPFGMDPPDQMSSRVWPRFGSWALPSVRIATLIVAVAALTIWWFLAAKPFDPARPRELTERIVNLPQREPDPLATNGLPTTIAATRQAAPGAQPPTARTTTTTQTPLPPGTRATDGGDRDSATRPDQPVRPTMLAKPATAQPSLASTAQNGVRAEGPADHMPPMATADQPRTTASTERVTRSADETAPPRPAPPPTTEQSRVSDTDLARARTAPSERPQPRLAQESATQQPTSSAQRIDSERTPPDEPRAQTRQRPSADIARASSTVANGSPASERTRDSRLHGDEVQRLTTTKPAARVPAEPKPARPLVAVAQTPARTSPSRDQPTSTPRATPPTPAEPSVRKADGDRIVRGFAAAYRAGNVDALAGLFADDAQVNEGRGAGFIRKDYARFFERVPERTFDLEPVTWRVGPHGGLSGRAKLGVRTRAKGDTDWRSLAGTIEFDLIATADGARIARMIHRLEPAPDRPLAQKTSKRSGDAAPTPVTAAGQAPSAQQADATLQALTRAYERGDLDALVGLFAANAKVSGGQGAAFIRQDYRSFFAQTPERQMQIRSPNWRTTNDGRLVGTAYARVALKPRDASNWRHLEGTLSFELVKTPAGPRIARLLDSLK